MTKRQAFCAALALSVMTGPAVWGANPDVEREAPARFGWSERPSEGAMDARAALKRDEAIAKLRRLIPTIEEGPQKANLYFRLSEMYWTKSKHLALLAMEQWDKSLSAWHQAGATPPKPRLESAPEYDQARVYRLEALELYRRILAKYPRYERLDEVLFNLGSVLYETGDKKEGVSMYWTLIKQFPRSRFTPDAWVQLGENFFVANRLSDAQRAYAKAMKSSRTLEKRGGDEARVYSFALYKLAWCDFNLHEYVKALEKFTEVIRYAKQQQSKEMSKRDRIQLYEESLSDLVRVYSYLDALEGAFEFYRQELGAGGAYPYLLQLAKRYNAEGKYSLEIKTYRRLNESYPFAPAAPANQAAIMTAFSQLGRDRDVRREARRLLEIYAPGGAWWVANADDQNVQSDAYNVVEREFADFALEQHQAAQRTKLVEAYELARDLYRDYLAKFTETLNSRKFRFFYAEILFELQEFREAAEVYDRVARGADDEFRAPAAYTAILAWERVLSGKRQALGKKIAERTRGKAKGRFSDVTDVQSPSGSDSIQRRTLTDIEKRLIDACDLFARVVPQDESAVRARFKAARLYFVNKHYDEAEHRFESIVDNSPTDPLARRAAELILESANARGDWRQLEKYARKIRAKTRLMADRGFVRTVDEFIEGASFNKIQESKRTPLETAVQYTGFVREFPESRFAIVALYNAMINYEKASFLAGAIGAAETLLKRARSSRPKPNRSARSVQAVRNETQHDDSPKLSVLRAQSMLKLATFKARVAEVSDAIRWYERYLAEFSSGAHRQDALFNLALLRQASGDHAGALAGYRAYLKDFSSDDDSAEVAWRVGEMLEDTKQWRAAERQFTKFARMYSVRNSAESVCASFRAQLARSKQKSHSSEAMPGWRDLRDAWNRLPAGQRSKPCPLEAAGAAAFFSIEPDYQEFIALTLNGSSDELTRKLLDKLRRVDELQSRYIDVVAVGSGEYGIAALCRIGRIFNDLANDINESQCPKRLTEEQCMIYQSELQAKSLPIEDKAVEAYERAVEKAYELGLYNTWLARAIDALSVSRPGRFPRPRKFKLTASDVSLGVPEFVEVTQ